MASRQSSARPPAISNLKTAAALSLAAIMAACATPPAPGPGPGPGPGVIPPPPPEAQVQTREGVTPPFMRGRERQVVRVGLLLPFSLRPQEAQALYNAAELALFERGDQNTLLIPRDAGADAATAAAAARALLADGVDIIVGPVLRDGVEGARDAVRDANVPVIGFSSDRTVGGNGVYLLSFQLEDEIARIVSYAASRNIRTLALLAPENEYGRRVDEALRAEAARHGVAIVHTRLYSRTDGDAANAATALAGSLRTQPVQGILIAESGAPLRSIGVALVRAGVDQRQVRFIGTSAWGGEAQREPSLAGGWYVSPALNVRQEFDQRYMAMFSREPTRLASLAYDAVALAALLSRSRGAEGLTRQAIENPEGFAGSDGIFRFRADGAVERGLAIIEVRQNEVIVLDAAPTRFAPARR